MTRTVPKAQIILDYNTFFGVEPPVNRISLIKHICKESILYEITALNYRLKPKEKVHIDTSFETQVKELKYFTKTHEIFSFYANVAERYTLDRNTHPIIFNRQACLFAIEEIINSDEMETSEDFDMAKIEVWEAIVKYLLAVNYAIITIKAEKDDENMDFEYLNPKLLPLNELAIEVDQIFTPFRGYWLIDYFLNNPNFSSEIKSNFQETYGIEPQHFIFNLMSMYMANSSDNPELNFFYLVKDGQQDLFDRLSKRYRNSETYKLLSIRKSPFVQVGSLKYLITDISFLIESKPTANYIFSSSCNRATFALAKVCAVDLLDNRE